METRSLAASLAAATGALGLLAIQASAGHAQSFTVTNLVSDGSVPAVTIDPQLINPWGISDGPGKEFWVSDNGTGVSTLYDGAGTKVSLVVTIPPSARESGAGAPSGQVFNGTPAFQVSSGGKTGTSIFIFAGEGGTISGWAPSVDGTNAILAVDNSRERAVYKGMAIAATNNRNFLYVANFRAGFVEMYNGKFRFVKAFTDPAAPAGYAPFNVQNLGGTLYVTFAKQDARKMDDKAGPGHGYVDAFTLEGRLLRRLVSGGPLNSPWGLDIAPPAFGAFAGDLLVGNFGDGVINAFDPTTGAFKGPLKDANGLPLVIGDLWGLINGNGGEGGDLDKVYFTAGVQDEAHGLLGSIQAAP